MAKFKGELIFKVSFKSLGIPVGIGMTNAIINHYCATQIGARTCWSKIDKKYIDNRFKVSLISKKVFVDEE